MEITVTLRKQDMPEIWSGLIEKGYCALIHGLAALLILLGATTFLRNNLSTSVILFAVYLIGAIALECMLRKKKKELLKTSMSQWEAAWGDKDLTFLYRFDEKTLHAVNILNGKETEMDLSLFVRRRKTKHFVLVLTKERQYLALDKETFATVESFFPKKGA